MTFGEQNTEKEAHEILSYAFGHGINILDTAEAVSISLYPHISNKSLISLAFYYYVSYI